MPLRLLPVFTLAVAGFLAASCSKQPETAPAAAPAAPAASTAQPAAQSAGQTTNFEDNTQTQAPPPPAAPTS